MAPPITDFNEVFPKPGDLASPLDVFNDDNKKKQLVEEVGSIKKNILHAAAEMENSRGRAGAAHKNEGQSDVEIPVD